LAEATSYPRPDATARPAPTELASRQEDAEALAERFQALADANRLKAIHLLHTRGEMCACELGATLGVTASNLSFHLQVLRHAGFVKSRRSGKWILYRLAPEQPITFMAAVSRLFVDGSAPLDAASDGDAEGKPCLCGSGVPEPEEE